MILRRAHAGELQELQGLEQRAGERFADVGLPDIATGPNLPLEVLEQARQEGLLWVAAEPGGPPLGFLAAEEAGSWLHVHELDVEPLRQGEGLGASLLEAAFAEAGLRGLKGVSLTTFGAVPWNAPYYLRRGFEIVDPSRADPALRALWDHEESLRAQGPRVLMVRRGVVRPSA
ncbi:MAG TPA: GNAT family N-acetyltransferase [Holophagaceae bacterium]|nr:GNAT family N-acetyltransferase [Holophagaceae bacterium]